MQHTCYNVEIVCVSFQRVDFISCFYIASLWLWWFLWIGPRQVVFAPSSLCVWSQRPWRSQRPRRSQQIILWHQVFLHVHLLEFDGEKNNSFKNYKIRRSFNKRSTIYCCNFSRKSTPVGLFMSQKTVSMAFSID